MNTTDGKIYLSKKGMKELRKSITGLERAVQKVRQELREIDKSSAHEEQLILSEKLSTLEGLESELSEKQLILSRAQLLPRRRDALKVALGSIVDLIDSTGRVVRYQLVESIEANPSDGRISVKSPLGQNLIGKTIRDTIQWGSGFKAQRLQLIRIN